MVHLHNCFTQKGTKDTSIYQNGYNNLTCAVNNARKYYNDRLVNYV